MQVQATADLSPPPGGQLAVANSGNTKGGNSLVRMVETKFSGGRNDRIA